MKKMVLFISVLTLSITLAGCGLGGNTDDTPTICEEGYELNDAGNCVVIEEDNNDNNDNTNTETALKQAAIDAIVSEMDGNPTYLGTVMSNMEFEDGIEITFEADLELEVNFETALSVHAVIVDTMVDNMMKREVTLDADGETFEFAVIYEETATGVLVYLQPSLVLDALSAAGDVDAYNALLWVGFDSEWVVFEFDESLQSMIELDVLKDMLSSMFFNEMGSLFFYDVQTDLEEELGIDLGAYGVDLGQWIDDLLEENYTAVETSMGNVDVDGIMMEVDYIYLSYVLRELMEEFEVELRAEGFNYDVLYALVNTSHYDELLNRPVLNEGIVLDGTKGVEVFLQTMTSTDEDAIVEVFKGELQTELYYALEDELSYYEMWDLQNILSVNKNDFDSEFGAGSGQALLDSLPTSSSDFNLKAFWEGLTTQEQEWFYNISFDEYNNTNYYYLNTYYGIQEYIDLQSQVVEFLTSHTAELEALGYTDIASEITFIETNGLHQWIRTKDETFFDLLAEEYVYGFLTDLDQAISDGTGLEFLMNTIFGDPHVEALFAEIPMNPVFDASILPSNMVLIDWNAIGNESVDLEGLVTAIYEGGDSYTAFLNTLDSTAPNTVLLLEIYTPGVYSLEDYMFVVDEVMYSLEGLTVFEDFLSLDYYMNDILVMTTETTEDTNLLVTMELDGAGSSLLVNDLVVALDTYLEGFTLDELSYYANFICTDGEGDMCYGLDIDDITAVIEEMGSTYVTVEMDPTELNWANITVDASDFLTSIATFNMPTGATEYYGVTDIPVAQVSISMKEVSQVATPALSETNSMNDIVVDFAKFGVTAYGAEILFDVVDTFDGYTAQDFAAIANTPMYLSELPGIYVSQAFDEELSAVMLVVNPTSGVVDFQLSLYWADGTQVFTNPLSSQALQAIYISGFATNDAAYDTLVGFVDDSTFSMVKVWLMLASEDQYVDKEPIETVEPY